ncbi:hypothetical protein HYPSUDRAFT_144805 [Hypholoma sublateritium FD-334 SS-4]|uniref:CS domain-containing protein n=1 Tax=Hypholoma sublateritium (strain FD-334 SS-4) TaxID=945553 RepID=A0A0D2NP44_HYPSF|nr:hypothetical protein HYPSUDRAFT_144805 [Hypholoma sublateritium FD-334 SS-4]
MLRCLRKGCGADYTEDENTEICSYHPGAPVFHEGLKSWSCCKDMNKPVMDFEEFMAIQVSRASLGCTEIQGHTRDAPQASPTVKAAPQNISATIVDGKEFFQVGNQPPPPRAAAAAPAEAPQTPAPVMLEEDDLNTTVSPGTVCRRKGCGTIFVSNEVNRQGDGEGTVCHYHPLPAIFREGSKGYLCCKRRVLEFDEFLKISGCNIGRHCFVPLACKSNICQTEEQVDCRIDHYQTPQQVHVSVFAKKADKERSSIKFESNKITLDLYLPGQKRFSRTINLFGCIDSDNSSFQFFGTKVELHLQKGDGRMWTVLEKTDRDLGNISLTFGVGGRTGTVGGKQVILDEGNRSRSEAS